MLDLHTLPKVRDSLSFLYIEHARIEQEAHSISVHDAAGRVPVPCASLNLLMLGPGTNITHAAVKALADTGCAVMWGGEGGVRFYAMGLGETRSARNLLRQAAAWADPKRRLAVVRCMYEMRFDEKLEPDLTLQQIRGKEGIRVRTAYAHASRESGVPWTGRSYRRDTWGSSDLANRALSAANSCLYGVCHAAIVAAGFSPAIGFIHTGKMLSFVYDIADLYKTEVTIPAAFRAASLGATGLEAGVRRGLRDQFVATRLLDHIVVDVSRVIDAAGVALPDDESDESYASDFARPGALWDPVAGAAPGGQNWGDELPPAE